ncbi:MAG: hypothetical protein M5U14_19920 [Acidimicrobiia bacterium]|nr:hypothetical protein [Acidimicrobiia bacterium]
MPRLTPADEYLFHQIPEPYPNVVTFHDHWRDSLFFVAHPRSGSGDVVILTLAGFPRHEVMDSLQMGRIDGGHVFARHARPYDGDPHTMEVGPVRVDVVEPFRTVHLTVDQADSPVGLDLTFTARTPAYGLRRGTMKAGHETIWDQSHLIQSGTYHGWYSHEGRTHEVRDWWGQRDHSWGIRDHHRCPLWMWLAIQLPDGMLGVWHWEYPNGAPVYTDGCFAPAGGGDPVPVVDFRHELTWTGADGRPVGYGRDGTDVRGLAGRVDVVLEGGQRIGVAGEGTWAAPYGQLGGGEHLMVVRTDDGREGNGIYEITGAHHHHFFPVPRAEHLPTG